MSVVRQTTRCKYCGEAIPVGALRCRHCHSDLPVAGKKPGALAQFNNFRIGFLAGALFTIVLLILVYFQFNS